MMSSAFYRIEHHTRYVHTGRVSTSQQVGCLTPRSLPWQIVHAHELVVDPRPTHQTERTDYFGNLVTQFTILTPYTELHVATRGCVEVLRSERAIDPPHSPPWEEIRDARIYQRGARSDEVAQFLYPSPYIEPGAELAAFARRAFSPGRPLVSAAIELMSRIHDEFIFDSGATTIQTPVTRVLSERRGVCQDFAHLQIACLRSLGLPARYVSGYLLTDPPPGQARLFGADASHAWVSVWCPLHGWVDLDPTNAVLPAQRHVTLAWGRDFSDVSPLRGVVLGGGKHELYVGVSVIPVESAVGLRPSAGSGLQASGFGPVGG
jgi:transglutaminase-like putative cysteine protease